MRKISVILACILSLFMASQLQAHPGRTDANGCHKNHKTGEFHCHGNGNSQKSVNKQKNSQKEKNSQKKNNSQKEKTFYKGQVISVADGDTITLRTDDFEQIKIRFYGIDAPEKNQPFGQDSKQEANRLLYGKNVEVEVIDEDRYGRMVGLITVDGLLVNLHMVKSGLAWLYSQYCKIPDVCQALSEAEQSAKQQKLGLWQDDDPMPPWKWRKK